MALKTTLGVIVALEKIENSATVTQEKCLDLFLKCTANLGAEKGWGMLNKLLSDKCKVGESFSG